MQIPRNPYVRVVPVCYFFVVVFVLFFFLPQAPAGSRPPRVDDSQQRNSVL